MKQTLTLLGLWRVAMAFLAVGAAIVLAACPRAAGAPTEVSFATRNLTAVVVPTLTAGMPMTAVTLPEATGGSETETLTYRVTPTVPGLAFDPATRVLSGTPTVPGDYRLTYTATTSDGDEAVLTFTVRVVSSFMGTWSASRDWWDDGLIVGTFTDTLTFTKSRYILHRAHYRTGSTAIDHEWSDSGTWDATDTTVTRIWLHDHDDDDETPRVERRTRKGYLWNEDRTVLCVQHWIDDEEDLSRSECDRLERVTTPAPADLIGTWVGFSSSWRFTFVLTPADFTVELVHREEGRTIKITGTYEIDPEELFILVTVVDVVWDGENLLEDPDSAWKKGVLSRWAFAPTDSPNRIVVSNHWEETNPNPDGPGFVDGDDVPYGAYWLEVEKQ